MATVALVVLLAIPKLLDVARPRHLGRARRRLVLAALIRIAARQVARSRRLSRRPSRRTPRRLAPDELLRMEREIVLGSADATPTPAAAAAPASGGGGAPRGPHGFDLERRPEAARALLGEDAWELLRPDRPEPDDRNDPGVLGGVDAMIARLEAL